jgi:hypothetical protein
MKTFAFPVFLVLSLVSLGQNPQPLVPNSTIAQDPAKEQLCIQRLGSHLGKAKLVPFLISPRYVELVRQHNPDSVFVAVDNEMSILLVECALSQGTGRFEPISYSGEGVE